MDLVEASDYHRRTLERLNRSPQTLRLYGVYKDSYLTFLREGEVELTLDALNPQLVRAWQQSVRLKSTGSRGGLVAEKQGVMTLKIWAHFLWDNEIFDVDPLARLKVPRVPRIQRKPFTQEEATRLVQAAAAGANPIRDRALLLMLFDTGCRVGELCAATLADIDLVEGSVSFTRTKNGRPRTVKFIVPGRRDGGSCLSALRQWLRVREARPGVDTLFTTRTRLPLSTRRVRELFEEFGEAARVPGAIPHRCRHTNASQFLAERPGAEIQLRSRLGQISRGVLSDYITESDQTAAEASAVASLSTKWNLGSSRSVATKQERALPEPRGRKATPSRVVDDGQQDLLERLVNDPAMRQKLLELLLKGAVG
jgi:site-specific recombinase XerC